MNQYLNLNQDQVIDLLFEKGHEEFEAITNDLKNELSTAVSVGGVYQRDNLQDKYSVIKIFEQVLETYRLLKEGRVVKPSSVVTKIAHFLKS